MNVVGKESVCLPIYLPTYHPPTHPPTHPSISLNLQNGRPEDLDHYVLRPAGEPSTFT